MDVAHRLLAELGEKDTDGNITLGGCKVEIQNGSVACLWKSGRTNRVARGFRCGFRRETGCIIADVGNYRVIDPGELVGLTECASGAPAGHGVGAS